MSYKSFFPIVTGIVREDRIFLIRELAKLIEMRRKEALVIPWVHPTNAYRFLKKDESSTTVAAEIISRAENDLH